MIRLIGANEQYYEALPSVSLINLLVNYWPCSHSDSVSFCNCMSILAEKSQVFRRVVSPNDAALYSAYLKKVIIAERADLLLL